MDEGNTVCVVECAEPEGTVVRHVRECRLSVEKLNFWWEKCKDFDSLFNDYIGRDYEAFVHQFIMNTDSGLQMKGLVYEVDDVGLLRMTDMRPGLSAEGHFVFWDKRLRGREELVREVMRYTCNTYEFHRIYAEIPALYTTLRNWVVNNLGMRCEGKMREACKLKGDWCDMYLYAILDRELANG